MASRSLPSVSGPSRQPRRPNLNRPKKFNEVVNVDDFEYVEGKFTSVDNMILEKWADSYPGQKYQAVYYLGRNSNAGLWLSGIIQGNIITRDNPEWLNSFMNGAEDKDINEFIKKFILHWISDSRIWDRTRCDKKETLMRIFRSSKINLRKVEDPKVLFKETDPDLFVLYINRGLDINRYAILALEESISWHIDILRIIMTIINVNQLLSDGETPLMKIVRKKLGGHHSFFRDYDEPINYLLKLGADLTIKNRNGDTVIDLAIDLRDPDGDTVGLFRQFYPDFVNITEINHNNLVARRTKEAHEKMLRERERASKVSSSDKSSLREQYTSLIENRDFDGFLQFLNTNDKEALPSGYFKITPILPNEELKFSPGVDGDAQRRFIYIIGMSKLREEFFFFFCLLADQKLTERYLMGAKSVLRGEEYTNFVINLLTYYFSKIYDLLHRELPDDDGTELRNRIAKYSENINFILTYNRLNLERAPKSLKNKLLNSELNIAEAVRLSGVSV